jgi:hypothetical protein
MMPQGCPGRSAMKLCLRIALILCMVSSAIPKTLPILTIDLKTLGLRPSDPSGKENRGMHLTVDFSANNRILVSFVRWGGLELRTKPNSTHLLTLIAHLLDANTGKVISRNQWQTETPPFPEIAPLRGGGFVVFFGNHLQVLDDELRLIQEKLLTHEWAAGDPHLVRVVGSIKSDFFGIEYIHLESGEQITQIIDSRTLTVAEQWKGRFGKLLETKIFEDYILTGEFGSVLKKQIGQEWRPFGSNLPKAGIFDFITADLYIEHFVASDGKNCWVETDGLSFKGKPICYPEAHKIGVFRPSWDGSIIKASIVKIATGFRAWLDLPDPTDLIVYQQGTHKILLKMQNMYDLSDSALSRDGSMLAVVREDMLSVYPIPALKPSR